MPTHDWSAPTNINIGGKEVGLATNEDKVDVYSKTFTTYPSLTPLTVILSKLSSDPAHNTRLDWLERNEIPTTVNIATTESSAGVTINVIANGKTLVLGTLLYNPRTNDLRRVGAKPTSNTITVVISQGGTTSAIWRSQDVVHVLPPAVAETESTDTYREASVGNDNVYNYVQLIRLQYALSRVLDKVHTYSDGGAGGRRQALKQQKYREFRMKTEKLLYFGGRATSGDNDETELRMMGGLSHYLRSGTLYKNFNGIMTESGWRNFLGDYKDQNPDANKIMCFCAGNVIDLIDEFGLKNVRVSPTSKVYGFDIYKYLSRGLQVDLVPLPLLTDVTTRGWGWILDMERIKLRYLDRPMFYPEAKNVGQSEIIYDTYRTVISLLVGSEKSHAMFVGAQV